MEERDDLNGHMKNRLHDEMLAGIKKSLTEIEQTLDKEPLIFIDSEGRAWLNDLAKGLFAQKRIPSDDFMEWLKIGSSYLQSLSYGEICVRWFSLPGNNTVACLFCDTAAARPDRIKLTSKEKEILRHLIQGLSNKEIAGVLKISPGTVNSHLDNVYRKLGCTNRVEACFIALKDGLFLPASDSAHGQEI